MKTIQTGDGDPRHGSMNGYQNLRCRCDDCRAAWAAYYQQARARRALRTPPPDAHGNPNTYSNWRCRCEDCRRAWAARCRAVYSARKAAL